MCDENEGSEVEGWVGWVPSDRQMYNRLRKIASQINVACVTPYTQGQLRKLMDDFNTTSLAGVTFAPKSKDNQLVTIDIVKQRV